MSCNCLLMGLYGNEASGKHHHVSCEKYKTEKNPYLFYFEEAINSFCPFSNDNIKNILDFYCMDNQEKKEIIFKRVEFTDEEFDNLPED